jgi:uncharacterized protein
LKENSNAVGPVSQSERIALIDSLRGIAILGILLMNIPYFSLPDPAADNLTVMHELGTPNQTVWYITNWLFDGTQRAIFSMLFGTGVILFTSRLEKRTEGIAPAQYFIRRQLWLVVFGLFDGYILLWTGDILFAYGIVGIIAFAFLRVKPKHLLIAAGVCLVLITVRGNLSLYRKKNTALKGEAIARMDTTKIKLTDQQTEDLEAMLAMKKSSDSSDLQKLTKKNLRQVRGNFADIYQNFSETTLFWELEETYYGIWDILIFMFIGMAFFKTGVLTGNAPLKFYWGLLIGGLGIGVPLSYLWLEAPLQYHFNWFEYYKGFSFEFYEIHRTFRSLGIFGLIMIMYKSGWFKWMFSLTRAVGQMAFTNYLMQSILCGLFFYGVGFGMYGKLQRYEAYYVVLAVWIVEIIWSNIWLRLFRFGPFEWLWRSLTYWKKQPMKRK